ncbi:MAG: hypoxanthine-guanine phosphoribosyltransferase [Lysobacterales bacterium]
MSDLDDFAAVLRRADRIHDTAGLTRAITRIARDIDAELDGRSCLFVTVMQGALVFAGQLATAVRAPLEFDYVHATRYRGATHGAELEWKHRPERSAAGRIVLLVDDILDEGHTLAEIRDAYRDGGAAKVLIATLCVKQHDRRIPGLAADFAGVDVPDRYVFGYGMDYHEQGRNLPAIYAVDA